MAELVSYIITNLFIQCKGGTGGWPRSSPAPFAKPHLRCSPLLRSWFLHMKRRSLQRFSQTNFYASVDVAPQFTSAIRKTASAMLSAAAQLVFAHGWPRSSPAPFAKTHLRCFPLLRGSFLLMRRRSLRMFMYPDFHASMKSVHKNIRVNC